VILYDGAGGHSPTPVAVVRVASRAANAPEVMGRPPKWPVPTREQIKVIVGRWHTPDRKRSLILEDTRKLVGADVPSHWVRDLVIKATGSARRSP